MKNQAAFALLAGLLILAACSSPAGPTPTLQPTLAPITSTPPPTATSTASRVPDSGIVESHPGMPLPTARGRLFAASGVCTPCHAHLVDEAGADVSIDKQWQASLEANAARDPFWQATVRAEILRSPALQTDIEDVCAACHMPMAHFTVLAEGGQPALFGEGLLSSENELYPLAMDGVSCTLCHQIREEGLGLPTSYSGGFEIDAELPLGDRLSFGPYSVDEALAEEMRRASGYNPVQSLHITQSELCASCHTFYNPLSSTSEEAASGLPLQMTYLEWFQSDYRGSETCQDCHMPEAQGGVRIATTSVKLRSPYAQHTFVGGNVYMLEMLKVFAGELATPASEADFAAAIERALDLLQNRTANLVLEGAQVSGSRLRVNLLVESQSGHKLPTGYPSRRVWIRFLVRDANEEVVFESGGFRPDGSIVDNDNDLDPSAFEPHYLAIVNQGQVQIYETILRGTTGGITTSLLQANAYLKDNRLLPTGLDLDNQVDEIAVRGRAVEDEDFLGGRDAIEYLVDLGDAPGPFTLTVELLYQSVGYRWAEEIRSYQSPETNRFLDYYQSLPNLPVVLASETIEVGGG